MGQIENMTLEDLGIIKDKVKELQKRNPDLTFKTFPQEDLEFAKRLTNLEEKIDSISNKLTNIFGSHILIDGSFKDLKLAK